MATNKVALSDGTVLMDLSPTTANAEDVASGKVFFAANGVQTTGTAQSSSGGNNPTLETEWYDVYSDWAAGYYYDPDNDYAYTQIPSTETIWESQAARTNTSCTPYSNLISVKPGEEYRYQNSPIHFDSKNAEMPSIIIFDSSKVEIEAYVRTYQDEWTEFTIPSNGAYMAVLYYNDQTYYLQKKEVAEDNFEILADVYSNYRTYINSAPPVTKTLTKGYICMGTDDLRRDQTKSLHALYTNANIPYYIAAIPEAVKACVTDDPYKTNLDYMRLCVAAGGEVVSHNAEQITNINVDDFDFINKYFRGNKKELEAYGFTVNGIFKAGGEGYIYGRDKRIDSWATMYYEYGDLFGYAYPYFKDRVILEYVGQSQIDDLVEEVCVNHGFAIVTTHDASDSATMYSYLMQKLGQYTRGTDYDFCTPSELYAMLMPNQPISGGGTDSDTKYDLSISSNVITLTGTDGQTSSVTLPVYNGGVT